MIQLTPAQLEAISRQRDRLDLEADTVLHELRASELVHTPAAFTHPARTTKKRAHLRELRRTVAILDDLIRGQNR